MVGDDPRAEQFVDIVLGDAGVHHGNRIRGSVPISGRANLGVKIDWQVWTLTQFSYLFPFCKKIIDLPVGQIHDPLSGKHYSLPFLQQLPSLGIGPLNGFLS